MVHTGSAVVALNLCDTMESPQNHKDIYITFSLCRTYLEGPGIVTARAGQRSRKLMHWNEQVS